MSLSFPVDRHRGVIDDSGTATVYAMMPSALKLFAEGRLTRVGGDPVEVAIGSRTLGPMVLTEVRCGGENYRHDIAVLVFRSLAPQALDPAVERSHRLSRRTCEHRKPGRRSGEARGSDVVPAAAKEATQRISSGAENFRAKFRASAGYD